MLRPTISGSRPNSIVSDLNMNRNVIEEFWNCSKMIMHDVLDKRH